MTPAVEYRGPSNHYIKAEVTSRWNVGNIQKLNNC